MRVEESAERVQGQEQAGLLEHHRMYRMGLAYGRFVYRSRWLIIIFWVLAVGASIPFAARLPTILSGGGYEFKGSESSHVFDILTDKLHQPLSQLLVVFQSKDTGVNDPAYQQEINGVSRRVRNLSYVKTITPGGTGQDGHTTFLLLVFNKDYDSMVQHVADIRTLLPKGAAMTPAHVYLTDQLAIGDELTQLSQQDAERADATVLPLALIVLLIVFGTAVAALTPLLLTLVAIPVALGLLYPLALSGSVSSFVINIVSIVGLGISIDYSLFITRRFREELAQRDTVQEAVAWTLATAGEAILFSGLTVMIGFIGLLLIGIGLTTSEGLGGMFVVAGSVAAALTLLPAVLAVLGTRINALRVPVLSRLTMPKSGSQETTGFWHRLAMGVMRRPITVILLVCVVLVGLGWPIFSLNIGTSGATILPASSEARQGLDVLAKQYPEMINSPIDVLAQTPDQSTMLAADNLNRVAHLSQWLARQPHVTSVVSLMQLPTTPGSPTLSQQQLITLYTTGAYKQVPALAQYVASTTTGGLTHIILKSDTKLDSDEGKAQIDYLRAAGKGQAQGLSVLVGGVQANYLDFDRHLYGNFPYTILFILVTTYIVLMLMFRSILLPLKAILMNVLSVSAAYGVLVFIFQWGNFSSILGFSSNGFVDSLVPILLFCVLFGLSMDYEVFLLSRIREEWLRTHDNRLAVAHGLEKTGSVITNAALLFVIVTVAFTFTTLVLTKEMGIGMTVAILVDATIIRSLLVPATMRLLGRWNWWFPGRPLPPRQLKEEGV